MFNNVPDYGTRIKIVQDIPMRSLRSGDTGTLRHPERHYAIDGPDDRFEAEFAGRIVVIRRRDVELA